MTYFLKGSRVQLELENEGHTEARLDTPRDREGLCSPEDVFKASFGPLEAEGMR